MNNDLKPYAIVRIKKLDQEPDEYDGWRFNERLPRVGDLGVILDILSAIGLPEKYVVENSASDGTTIWLEGAGVTS
jgi:hypothetical protein